MRRTWIVAVAVLATLSFSACDDIEPDEDSIDRGKRCADAGGSWTWSDWTGYHCEFAPETHDVGSGSDTLT